MKKNKVFIFDLHDVIVKKHHIAIIHHLIKNLYRLDILVTLIFLSCNPIFLYRVFYLWKTSRVPEQCIIELSAQYSSLKQLIDLVIILSNKQQPITPTLKHIETLKKRGHRLYLFSNIGEKTFNHFKQTYPTIVELFDGFVIAQHHDNWIQKPQRAAFKKLIKTFNLNPQDCIFIDNNKRNISIAKHEGFNTILYQSPRKLALALQALNVL